jgi:hypothetical protein
VGSRIPAHSRRQGNRARGEAGRRRISTGWRPLRRRVQRAVPILSGLWRRARTKNMIALSDCDEGPIGPLDPGMGERVTAAELFARDEVGALS